MAHQLPILSESSPLPAQLSENLRHISRKLNERGFVLRKRRAYVIEPMAKIAAKRDHYGTADLTTL
jgi:hypothetical protein